MYTRTTLVELRDRRLLIDGVPRLVLSGEIHYFRTDPKDWEDRIIKLKEVGCNAVASYIPWCVHEQDPGVFEVQQIADYIDLCHKHKLWFIARPGPFVMAEMKHEGIPGWVYEKHKDAILVSFKDEKSNTATLDFLNPGYLDAVQKWYGAVMPILAERLQPKGGPVIAVQLDNEVGMLHWVTNQPDLSDDTLCDFAQWIQEKYGHHRYPFDMNDPFKRRQAIRHPTQTVGPLLQHDLADFERQRFAKYFTTLRGYAEQFGVKGVPFIINIHGTGGGRSTMYPIGISQLYQAYSQDANYLPGSDHYLGEITRQNAQDMYFLNAFTAATTRPGQPIGGTEFEVGTGDYGEIGSVRMSGAAADFKIRMSIAQENRLLNYYLLAGGHNPHFRHQPHDGNGRVATTGERHGFAAPIGPEGVLDPTYFALKDTNRTLLAVEDKLANMVEEHDDLALAFVPDYYRTNVKIDGPGREITQHLEQVREGLENLTRSLLFLGFRFPAINIQDRPITSSALVFASCRHLSATLQHKLADWVKAGGRLLLLGDLPYLDMEGKPCTILADAIGVKALGFVEGRDGYSPAVRVTDEPEISAWHMHTVEAPHAEVFARVVDTKAAVGWQQNLGKGAVVMMGMNYPLHERFWRGLYKRIGCEPSIRHDDPLLGVLTLSTSNQAGERFLHVINLDSETRHLRITEHGKPMFDGARVRISGRKAKLLPLDCHYGPVKIIFSTAEIRDVGTNEVTFKPTEFPELVLVRGVKNHNASASEVIAAGQLLTQPPGAALRIQW